jgi:hypothetical protein
VFSGSDKIRTDISDIDNDSCFSVWSSNESWARAILANPVIHQSLIATDCLGLLRQWTMDIITHANDSTKKSKMFISIDHRALNGLEAISNQRLKRIFQLFQELLQELTGQQIIQAD